MVIAHVTDAWTREDDRSRYLYMLTVFIAGMAAPLFLFLAGLTLAMAASSRAAKVGHAEAAAWRASAACRCLRSPFCFACNRNCSGGAPSATS